ncbi:MAG: DUF6491 family protein, partial [Gammaproteobacteria bacterium]|nr:DUF6491 family protein [Gammaproteobacteria bacterium]
MRTLNFVSGVIAALALTGCASTGGSDAAIGREATFASDNDCFLARLVSDWRPLDNRNLLVFTGRRNPYHVQLSMPSTRLRAQDTIAFTDRDGRICPYGGDAVVINGFMPDRITIASIRRLSEGELEEVYLQFGIRRPAI